MGWSDVYPPGKKERMHVIINVPIKKGENTFFETERKGLYVFQSNYFFEGDIMLVVGGE